MSSITETPNGACSFEESISQTINPGNLNEKTSTAPKKQKSSDKKRDEGEMNGIPEEEGEDLTEREKLFDELFCLKLGSYPYDTLSCVLPPKQRIKLFRPRSKFEQFEDILLQSQLLESQQNNGESVNGLSDHLRPVAALDFETSDAIFENYIPSFGSDGNLEMESPSCDCNPCIKRCRMQQELQDEIRILRQCLFDLQIDVLGVYKLVMQGAWNDSNRDTPDMNAIKESASKLCRKDPHQLFQKLEWNVRQFVIQFKRNLIDFLQKQAKNPTLAEDFTLRLIDGYEKVCQASMYLTPFLGDLDNHLRRFTLTWSLFNKHIYQSIVYTDPLILNSLPIFISQLRSLYPDKEHEARYTEIVRSYLDFDVEMEAIDTLWETSGVLILEYNQKQLALREKQKTLKEDWEKLKVQKQQADQSQQEKSSECLFKINSVEEDLFSESLSQFLCGIEDLGIEGIPPDLEMDMRHVMNLESPSFFSLSSNNAKDYPTDDEAPAINSEAPSPFGLSPVDCSAVAQQLLQYGLLFQNEGLEEYEDDEKSLVEELPTCSFQNGSGSDTCECHACTSITSLEDCMVKCNLSSSKSEEVNKETSTTNSLSTLFPSVLTAENPKEESVSTLINTLSTYLDLTSSSVTTTTTASSPSSTMTQTTTSTTTSVTTSCVSTSTKTVVTNKKQSSNNNNNGGNGNSNSKEINKLLQQHYCGHKKTSPAPSASAVRKGKVPPPEHSLEDSEDEDTCSLSSDSKHCSCCYCEVFGQGGPSVAPVSRNYPEMRERLRLLLNKKKKCSHKQVESQHNAQKPTLSEQKLSNQPAVSSAKKEVKLSEDKRKTKEVDDILDFIEGNAKTTNEKKRAKKDRQKQQRLEEQRIKEEAERLKKQKEEEERRKREEEKRKAEEAAHALMKKRSKKEKQRAKRAAAKGLVVPPAASESDNNSARLDQLLDELKAQHLREVEELKSLQQKQLEETQKSLLLGTSNNNKNNNNNNKNVANVNPSSKPSQESSNKNKDPSKQVKITRTPNGGIKFTIFRDNKATTTSSPPIQAMQQSSPIAQPSFLPANSYKPSVPPTKPSSDTPMVTIKRVNTSDGESTVTISTKSDVTKEDTSDSSKLLYTLINGQVHKSQHAPENLLPNAKLLNESTALPSGLSKKQRKKLRKLQNTKAEEEEEVLPPSAIVKPRHNPLPTTPEGKLDLNNLNLPPGISITRIEGPVPERKYYPCKSEEESNQQQEILSVPPTPVGYSAMAGMPPGLNGPNVIVVDTSTLSGGSEEESSSSSSGFKTSKKKQKKKVQALDSVVNSGEDIKSGPQVLIKNVNGRVVITPVPADKTKKITKQGKENQAKTKVVTEPYFPMESPEQNGQKKKAKKVKKSSVGENLDELNRVFAPKDIDLENGEIDDDEREIEAFKRFCFNSVPLQQKTKVNFDVKNIAFKKK